MRFVKSDGSATGCKSNLDFRQKHLDSLNLELISKNVENVRLNLIETLICIL